MAYWHKRWHKRGRWRPRREPWKRGGYTPQYVPQKPSLKKRLTSLKVIVLVVVFLIVLFSLIYFGTNTSKGTVSPTATAMVTPETVPHGYDGISNFSVQLLFLFFLALIVILVMLSKPPRKRTPAEQLAYDQEFARQEAQRDFKKQSGPW